MRKGIKHECWITYFYLRDSRYWHIGLCLGRDEFS